MRFSLKQQCNCQCVGATVHGFAPFAFKSEQSVFLNEVNDQLFKECVTNQKVAIVF